MSYDLYFKPRRADAVHGAAEFLAYFAALPRYTVESGQARYLNEDSGVYFSFDISDSPEQNPQAEAQLARLSFNLNYFRPHAFGLEAEGELAALVERFDLMVFDPQGDGMSDGEYSPEGFLRSWNKGNEFGYRALLESGAEGDFLTLPTAAIENSWRWNYQRAQKQHEIGDGAFVPRIFYLKGQGCSGTGVAWPDGIASLLPTVDFVMIPRNRLAPRRWLRAAREDVVMVSWGRMQGVLSRFSRSAGGLESYELFYEATPDDIEDWIRRQKSPAQMPKGVPFDHVLNQELIAQARAQQPV